MLVEEIVGGEGGENRERDRSTTRARNASFGICSTAIHVLPPPSPHPNLPLPELLHPLPSRTSTVSSVSTALDNRIADAHKRSWRTKPQMPRLTPPPTVQHLSALTGRASIRGFACEERLAGDGERVREVGRWGGCRADGDAGGMEVEVWVLDVGMGEVGGCRGTWKPRGRHFGCEMPWSVMGCWARYPGTGKECTCQMRPRV